MRIVQQIVTLFLLLVSICCVAQTPCFSTIDTVGCVPFTVQLNNCSDAALPRYNYGEGIQTLDSIKVDSTHTYTTAGVYDVSQYIGTTSIVGITQPKLIRAVSDAPPLFSIKYCKDFVVRIQFSDENMYDRYIINYDDGSPLDTVPASDFPEKQYSDGTIRSITVEGIYDYAPCSNSSTLPATPQQDLILPDFNTLTNAIRDSLNGTHTIQASPSSFFRYALNWAEGTTGFTPLDTFFTTNGDTTLTHSGLDNRASSFCYYFNTFDYCFNELVGDTTCTISLDASAANNRNSLTWPGYPLTNTIDGFFFVKNEADSVIGKTTTSLIDSAVVCANEYCYQIKTTTQTNTTTLSNINCVTSFSTNTPNPINDFKASIENEEIVLTWSSPSPYIVQETAIQKSSDGFSYAPFTTTSDFDSTTSDIFTATPACYIINYIDACGNASDTQLADTTCYAVLNAEQIHDSKYILNWSSFKGINNQSYIIQYLDDNGNVAHELPVSGLAYTDENPFDEFQKLTYRIKIVGDSDSSFTNTLSFDLKSRINTFTSFSPNGDNVNDFFKPDTRFIQDYSLKIFNRWGQLLYEETNGNNSEQGWDGYFDGELVPIDSYVYILDATDFNGENLFKKGTVSVFY